MGYIEILERIGIMLILIWAAFHVFTVVIYWGIKIQESKSKVVKNDQDKWYMVTETGPNPPPRNSMDAIEVKVKKSKDDIVKFYIHGKEIAPDKLASILSQNERVNIRIDAKGISVGSLVGIFKVT